MNQRTARIILFLIVIFIGTFVARGVILGGASVISLKTGPLLSGAVSQSLGASSLPTVGKDFELKNIHYFDNRDWVVVSAASPNKTAETNIVILRRISGMYQTVLGPGTAFPNGYLQSLPVDVAQYLSSQGVIYEPISK